MGIADDCLCHITILLEANKGCTHKKLHQSSISRRYLPKNPPSVADDNSIQKKKICWFKFLQNSRGSTFLVPMEQKVVISVHSVYIYIYIRLSKNPLSIHIQSIFRVYPFWPIPPCSHMQRYCPPVISWLKNPVRDMNHKPIREVAVLFTKLSMAIPGS